MSDTWQWERVTNYRQLQAMERRQDWLEFVLEFQKQLLLNYRRHLFPDHIIQVPPMPPYVITPTDLNRMLREKEALKKRLGYDVPVSEPEPPEPPGPVEPPMTVLGRQMFQPSGTLTAAAPGDFSSVTGILYQQAGGAHLFDEVAASADPMLEGQTYPFYAHGNLFQALGHLKVVIGCWFYFKQVGWEADNKAPIMFLGQDPTNPIIQLVVSQGTLKSWSLYQDATLQSLPFSPAANEWLYISMAARWVSAQNWSVRSFYKHPKGNLTQWNSWDNVTCWTGTEGFGTASYGMFGNAVSYQGRISACTIHAFENDDFSDVVYPSEIIEPV